jgi:hypothetical protein
VSDPETPQFGANCPISMPHPIEADVGAAADMGGFVFTSQGLMPDLTATDRDEILSEAYGPTGDIDGHA